MHRCSYKCRSMIAPIQSCPTAAAVQWPNNYIFQFKTVWQNICIWYPAIQTVRIARIECFSHFLVSKQDIYTRTNSRQRKASAGPPSMEWLENPAKKRGFGKMGYPNLCIHGLSSSSSSLLEWPCGDTIYYIYTSIHTIFTQAHVWNNCCPAHLYRVRPRQ